MSLFARGGGVAKLVLTVVAVRSILTILKGTCNGSGSRGGTGKCKCKKGFLAKSACMVCKDGLMLVPGVGRTAKCVKNNDTGKVKSLKR